MPQSKISISCQNPITAHMVEARELKISQSSISKEKPSTLIYNIQYPQKLIGDMPQCVHLKLKYLNENSGIHH